MGLTLNNRWAMLLITGGLLLVLVAAVRTPRPLPVSPSLVNPFPVSVEACSDCFWCPGGHKAPSGGSYGGVHDWCMAISGCEGHVACGTGGGGEEDPGGDEEELYQLVDRAAIGDRNSLAEAIVRFPTRVHLNATRRAVQVESCVPGSIVAHISLSPTEYERLAWLQETADAAPES